MGRVNLLVLALLAMSMPAAVNTLAVSRTWSAATSLSTRPTSVERAKLTAAHSRLTVHAQRSFAGLPVYADGATAPDLIPAQLAYRHLLMAFSIRSVATPEEVRRRDSLLRLIGLSPADNVGLTNAIASLKDQLIALNDQRNSAGAAQSTTAQNVIASLQQQEGAILDKAKADVIGSLSLSGAATLDNFVLEHVRRHIVFYGGAPTIH